MRVPILRLKNILLTTIQVDLTDHDALVFQADALRVATETGAMGMVIDITGLDVVDSFMARILNETAKMLRLVGVKAVICGMSPSVALTLTEMGTGLEGVDMALNLDQAMDRVQRAIGGEKSIDC